MLFYSLVSFYYKQYYNVLYSKTQLYTYHFYFRIIIYSQKMPL